MDLFQQHGPAGLVRQVAQATMHGLPNRAESMLRAMLHIHSREDRLAALQARGPAVIAVCLKTFPKSLGIARAALIAGLAQCWNGGVAPFFGARTKCVVKAILKAMATFKTDLLVCKGGVRLLALHASSRTRMVEAPSVVEQTAVVMRRWPDDMIVQNFGARVIGAYNGVEPHQIKEVHGEVGYNSIAVTSVALAVSTRPSLQIRGQPWQQLVLTCYPKLRQRA